jgi:hypothetical protein
VTLLPKIKLKAAVNFPATVLDGTGIDVTKSNGTYRFDLDFADFAPPVGSVTDAAHQNALLWNSVTGSYTLAPMTLLSGGSLPDAPNTGLQYGRQSLGWTQIVIPPTISPSATLPVMDGTAIAGVATAYSRGDHVHPTDTSRASSVFTQVGTGAVNRTMLSKAQDIINAADFGLLPSNTGAQNVTAWGVLMTFAASNPCTIKINRGTYDFNAQIAFNPPSTRLSGDGIDATILRCTFASGNFIVNSGTIYYQTIDNLTLTSSVTRTGGAMFSTGFWKRGMIYRVKISNHLHGINLPQFEQCTIAESNIVSPSGNGTGIYAGAPAATNQGANLNLLNCFIRGSDETVPGSTAVGLHAMEIYDVEGVFSVNSDFSGFTSHNVMITPQSRTANCFFAQTYFDATVSGHNIYIAGAGLKLSISFTACWFAGAGNYGAGSTNSYGIMFDNVGTYQDIVISAGRFITTSASGIFVVTPNMGINVTGSSFINCGFNAGSTNRDAIIISPSSAASRTMNITGNSFESSGGFDVKLSTSNANGRVNLAGNAMTAGVSWPDGTFWGNVGGNIDPSRSPLFLQVPSASTIQISPDYNYVVVSGTTSINRIQPTYPGHQISIRFIAALTVVDDGNNLRLVGNFVTTANSILTLVCEGNGDWRELSRATS